MDLVERKQQSDGAGTLDELNSTQSTDETLSAHEKRWQTLLQAASDLFWITTPLGELLEASASWQMFTGLQKAASEGLNWLSCLHPADQLRFAQQWQLAMLQKNRFAWECRIQQPTGSYRIVSVKSLPVLASNKTVREWLHVGTDITDSREREAELQQTQSRFQLATEAAETLIYDWNLQDNHVERTGELFNLLGYHPASVPPTQEWWVQHIHPDDLKQKLPFIEETVRSADRFQSEYRVRHKDGHYLYVWERGRVLRNEQGQPIRVVGSTVDISELKQLEEALRQSEQRYRIMGETVPYGVWMCDAVGRLDYLSQSFLAMLGMTFEECLQHGWFHRLPPEDVPAIREKWRQCVLTGAMWEQEYRLLGADGLWHTVFTRGLPVRDEQGNITCWVGLHLDIDERTLLQEEIQQRTTILNTIVEKTADLIYVKDQQGKFLLINPPTAHLIGRSREEIIGKDDFDFFPPSIAQPIRDNDQRIMTTGKIEVIEEMVPLDGEERIFLSTKVPYTNQQGQVIGLIGISKDITDRKAQEQQKDTFISMASHELRTPITTAKANLQLIERRLRPLLHSEKTLPPEMQNTLVQVATWLTRSLRQLDVQNRLINDLLDVSRIQSNKLELSPTLWKLHTIVHETVEDQRVTTPTRTIHIEGAEQETVLVIADRDRIRQVLSNYLSNALKYSPTEQPVTVGVTLESHAVRVWVRDQGPGLSPQAQQQIWERFYQVPGIRVQSGSGVGLGLGLYICQTLISRHDGTVGVESSPGHGSTFWFTLPRADRLLSSPLALDE